MVVQVDLLTESYFVCKELESHKNTFISLVEKETIGFFLELNSPPVDEVKWPGLHKNVLLIPWSFRVACVMLTHLLSLAPTFRCLCYYSIIDDSLVDKCTQKKQGTIPQFLNLSQFSPHFKVDLTTAFISHCNCYRLIILFYQETFILRKKVILIQQITYPRTNRKRAVSPG